MVHDGYMKGTNAARLCEAVAPLVIVHVGFSMVIIYNSIQII
jgi:hypothetical protein